MLGLTRTCSLKVIACAPCWTFVVTARYLKDCSIAGMPPEFASSPGCDPDSGIKIDVANLADCPQLSLRWRPASTNGAWLGYLAEPLRTLGLQPGGCARVTIKAPRMVELSAHVSGTQRHQSEKADATSDAPCAPR